MARTISGRALKRSTGRSAMALMKVGSTQVASNMVPPLMPGTRFASPISVPPKRPRGTNSAIDVSSPSRMIEVSLLKCPPLFRYSSSVSSRVVGGGVHVRTNDADSFGKRDR